MNVTSTGGALTVGVGSPVGFGSGSGVGSTVGSGLGSGVGVGSGAGSGGGAIGLGDATTAGSSTGVVAFAFASVAWLVGGSSNHPCTNPNPSTAAIPRPPASTNPSGLRRSFFTAVSGLATTDDVTSLGRAGSFAASAVCSLPVLGTGVGNEESTSVVGPSLVSDFTGVSV